MAEVFRNALLRRIDDADLALLRGSMNEVVLARDQQLYEAGERIEHLYFPGTAVVSVVTVMENGQCVETGTIGYESAPGVLNILANQKASSRVFTQVPGSGMRIPAALIRETAGRSPAFLQLLLEFAAAGAAQAELSVACNALHSLPSRLARWLLLTQDRVGADTVPLTQEFLSIMLGVQRTTVSAASAGLKQRGLIRYSRGTVQILDRDGLKAAACECYEAGRSISDALIDLE